MRYPFSPGDDEATLIRIAKDAVIEWTTWPIPEDYENDRCMRLAYNGTKAAMLAEMLASMLERRMAVEPPSSDEQ